MKLSRYKKFVSESFFKDDIIPTMSEIEDYFQAIKDDVVSFLPRYIIDFSPGGIQKTTFIAPMNISDYKGYKISIHFDKTITYQTIEKEIYHIVDNMNIEYPNIRYKIIFLTRTNDLNSIELCLTNDENSLSKLKLVIDDNNLNENLSHKSIANDIPQNIDDYFQTFFDNPSEYDYEKEFVIQTESDSFHDFGGYEIRSYDFDKKPYTIIGYHILFRFNHDISVEDWIKETRHILYNLKSDYPNLCMYYSIFKSHIVENISVGIYILNKYNKSVYDGSIRDANYLEYDGSLNESIKDVLGRDVIDINKLNDYFQSLIDDGASIDIQYKVTYNDGARWYDVKVGSLNDIPKDTIGVRFNQYMISIDCDRDKLTNMAFRREINHCLENIKIDNKGMEYEIDEFYNLGDTTTAVVILYNEPSKRRV